MQSMISQLLQRIGFTRYYVILILSGFTWISVYKSNLSQTIVQKITSTIHEAEAILLFAFFLNIAAVFSGIVIIFVLAFVRYFGDPGKEPLISLKISLFAESIKNISLFGWFFGILLWNM